jgi:NRPS condensation-like uncharacterized protein
VYASIPARLPARIEDIALYTMAYLCDPLIQLVIDLDGPLDGARLRRSFRLLLDAEPVLGCVFVDRWIRPYWRRLDDQELDRAELVEERSGSGDERERLTQVFLSRSMAGDRGPRIAALWIRGDDGDRLVLKVHHQAADAGGTKEVAYRLAGIYRALRDDPGFLPRPRLGSRSLRQVYSSLSPRRLSQLLVRIAHDVRDAAVPRRHLLLPSGNELAGRPLHHAVHLEPATVRRLADNGLGATLNDVACAAFLRAVARVSEWNGRDTLRLWGTVDLRRYLPDRRADALCNLSGFMFARFGNDLGERFEDTLAIVKEVLDGIKGRAPGLGYPLTTWLAFAPFPLGVLRWMIPPARRHVLFGGAMPPVLTNMGLIDDDLLRFDGPTVEYAWLIVPTSHPAGFIAGLSGFRGGLTMTANHYESAVPGADIRALLQRVADELSPTEEPQDLA